MIVVPTPTQRPRREIEPVELLWDGRDDDMGIETRNSVKGDALYSAWIYGENKENIENHRRGLIERGP
jgi:hypothetical protein